MATRCSSSMRPLAKRNTSTLFRSRVGMTRIMFRQSPFDPTPQAEDIVRPVTTGTSVPPCMVIPDSKGQVVEIGPVAAREARVSDLSIEAVRTAPDQDGRPGRIQREEGRGVGCRVQRGRDDPRTGAGGIREGVVDPPRLLRT